MSNIPLIWRYAERIDMEEIDLGMFYDPEKKMNCINIDNENIPVVEARSASLGTMTITEVRGEETDQDPSSMIEAFYGTETLTRMVREDTDQD